VELESVARQYIHSNYGNMVMLGKHEYEEEPNLHRFELRTNYPIVMRDDSESGNVRVRVLKMERLGNIFIDENMHIDKSATSPRNVVASRIRDNLALWRRRIEDVVAASTSSNLARLNQIYPFFIPIERIITILEEDNYISMNDLRELGSGRRKKYLEYIRLLQGQDLLERHSGGWRKSIQFDHVIDPSDSFQVATQKIIAILIAKRYRTLKEDFNMTVLDGAVKLQNVVYLPEIEEKKNLPRKRDTLKREYYYHYQDNIAKMDLLALLRNLEAVDSVTHDRDRNMYGGKDELREDMIERYSALRPIGEIHKARA